MPKLFEVFIECPRKKWLSFYEIQGIQQYRERRNEIIYQYILERINKIPKKDYTQITDYRVIDEIKEEELDAKIDAIISKYNIEIGEKKVVSINSIENEIYEGRINGERALIKLSISKKIMKHHYYGLIMGLHELYPDLPSDIKLVLISPMMEKIIFLPKNGVLTKDGSFDKRMGYSGSWDILLSELLKSISDYQEFIQNSSEIPSPLFGECGFCEYHNIEVTVNANTFRCTG